MKCRITCRPGQTSNLQSLPTEKQRNQLICSKTDTRDSDLQDTSNQLGIESEFYIQYMLGPLEKQEIELYEWVGKKSFFAIT